ANSRNVIRDLLRDFGDCGVEHVAIARESPCVGDVRRRLQRSIPDAWTSTRALYLRRERLHVAELVVPMVPRSGTGFVAAAARLPAIVDYRKRTVRTRWREVDDVLHVGEDARPTVLAVRPVPVVASIYRFARQSRVRAHPFAEGVHRRERP